MGVPKKVTPEVRAQILEMRRERGKTRQTTAEIAAHFGLGYSTVQRVFTDANKAAANGLSPSKAAARQRMQRVAELRSQGYSYAEVGELMHITKAAAAYYGLRAEKLSLTSPQRPNRRRHITPIVLGAETVAQTDERRLTAVYDLLWSGLSADQKLQALSSLTSKEN